MSTESGHDAARRRFLASSAAAAGAIGAPLAQAGAAIDMPAGVSVLLHDRRIGLDEALVQRLTREGTRVIALDDDPVQMWRGELGTLLRDPRTRLFGISRWADLLIVRGLAAETRRHLRHEQLDAEGGTFTWLIA